MNNCLYKIGDLITPKFSDLGKFQSRITHKDKEMKSITPQPFRVVEILMQECPGGVQVHYSCRAIIIKDDFEDAMKMYVGSELYRLNEAEVEPFPVK